MNIANEERADRAVHEFITSVGIGGIDYDGISTYLAEFGDEEIVANLDSPDWWLRREGGLRDIGRDALRAAVARYRADFGEPAQTPGYRRVGEIDGMFAVRDNSEFGARGVEYWDLKRGWCCSTVPAASDSPAVRAWIEDGVLEDAR